MNDTDGLADHLADALASGDADALGALLSENVTWGDCRGRADVVALIASAREAGMAASDVSVEALDDRVLVSFVVDAHGSQRIHQVAFVGEGGITEIRDVADDGEGRRSQPLGSLDSAAGRRVHLDSMAAVLPVRDVAAAAGHYRTLGFTVELYDGAPYAFADRDQVAVHLAGVADLDPLTNNASVYLYVTDADALYAQWRGADVAGRLVVPVDTDYGLREGAHVDPDGNLIRFGSPSR